MFAAALAQLDHLDEARSAIKAGLAVNPTFTVTRFHATWAAMSDNPKYLSQFEPILEGMRKGRGAGTMIVTLHDLFSAAQS